MAAGADTVRIRYRRPPDREQLFVQRVLWRDERVIVTFVERAPLERPLRVGDETVLEDGSPAIWFTYPGEWHDVGRFHRRDGTFTGLYANILTPVEFTTPWEWSTTDLYLDVWMPRRGGALLLDEDELERALRDGAIPARLAAQARAEAAGLLPRAAAGTWPGTETDVWTLARARRELDGSPCHGEPDSRPRVDRCGESRARGRADGET
jgi:predicted RNA-binding protein associated with RNAse of E/G family